MTCVDFASMLMEGRDEVGRTCWFHKPSGFITYFHPSREGLCNVLRPPNAVQGIVFFQSQDSIAEQWEEHTDEKTKKKYWYNKITKTSTWDDPKLAAKKPPPPPPPPAKPTPPTPPASTKIKEDKVEIREEDLWSKKDDGEGGVVWYNKNTKKSQRARPECMKKYRKPKRATK